MRLITKTMSGMTVLAAMLMVAFSSCSKEHEEQNDGWGGLLRTDPYVTPVNNHYYIWKEGTKIMGESMGNSIEINANEVTFDLFYFYGLKNGEILTFIKPCKVTLNNDNGIVIINMANMLLVHNLSLAGKGILTLSCNNIFSMEYLLEKMVPAEGHQITVSESTTDETYYHYENGTKYYNIKCRIEVKPASSYQ